MPEYLSGEWIAALDGALRASPVRTDGRIVIEAVVTGLPHGDVRYRVEIDREGASARASEPGDRSADLRFTTDLATAVGIARGTQNAQIALAGGKLMLGGDVNALTAHAGVLAALDDVSASLRTTTTYAK